MPNVPDGQPTVLAAELCPHLERLGSMLQVRENPKGPGHADVLVADQCVGDLHCDTRQVNMSLRRELGPGFVAVVESFAKASEVLHAWYDLGCTATEIGRRYPELPVDARSLAFDQRSKEYVDRQWRKELAAVDGMPDVMRILGPALRAASLIPALRQLSPYINLDELTFSRWTLGDSEDCPRIRNNYVHGPALSDGFRVYYVAPRKPGAAPSPATLFGVGGAEEAARLVADNLPKGCGPARHWE